MAAIQKNDFIEKLIQGCVKGDRQCQQGLYKHFYSFGMGISLRYVSDEDEAAYVLNESFFKIFENIALYDTEKPFMAWLRKIMTNTAIDYYRSQLKFSNHLDVSDHDQPSDDVNAYSELAYKDLLKMVQSLTPAYRTVFNLFVIDGYTHEEIGHLLEITVGTSKSNLFKARKKLQELLKTSHTHRFNQECIKRD